MDERDKLSGLNGIFIGMLEPDEKLAFDRLRAEGKARLEFSGTAGWLGLGKVRLLDDEAAA